MKNGKGTITPLCEGRFYKLNADIIESAWI